MCRPRRVCRQSRRRPQRPRSVSPSRTCAESDRPRTPSSGQSRTRAGKFELGAHLDTTMSEAARQGRQMLHMCHLCQGGVAQASVAERSIALPSRCGCAGANPRTMPGMARNRAFRIDRSHTGLGLFATAPIKKRAFIVEYKGRKLTTEQANKLEARGNRYLFEINSRWTIDGTSRKNLGRYVNHSCRPNAETQRIGHKVVMRAIKNIKTGAEITYNYGRDYLINVITRRGCKCDKCRKKRAAARAKACAKSRTSPAKPKKMGKKKCG